MPHSLPEDVNRWPADPYELLGVPREADVKAIKRAYAQLLREYRPDESPAEFQRLREAFEAALEYASFRARYSSEEDLDAPRDVVQSDLGKEFTPKPNEFRSDENVAPATAVPQTTDTPRVRDPRPSEKSPWELAVAGDSHAAWKLLEERSRSSTNPNDEEVLLQRYWLAKLTPGLSDRSPEVILFEAVKKTGAFGRLWQLLMLEWTSTPDRLLSPLVLELLDHPDGAERLGPLFAARWRAAGKAEQWSLLEEDLAPLRHRLLPDHASVWLTILVEQMRFGAWRPESEAANEWQESWFKELAQLSDLQLKASEQFDEAEQWYQLRQELLKVLPGISTASELRDFLWATTFEDRMAIKLSQTKLADAWRPQADVALSELDTLASVRPMLFLQLQQVCAWFIGLFYSSPLAGAEVEAQRPMVQRALRRILEMPPGESRAQVAAFCLRELMTVREFCTLANQHAPAELEQATHLLTGQSASDVSLHSLCQLIRAVEFERE